MLDALLGIPDLGPIAWAVLIAILAVDLGVMGIGIARVRYSAHHPKTIEPVDFREALRVRDRTRRGPEIEHPLGKEKL